MSVLRRPEEREKNNNQKKRKEKKKRKKKRKRKTTERYPRTKKNINTTNLKQNIPKEKKTNKTCQARPDMFLCKE